MVIKMPRQVVVDGASDCIYLAYDETVTAIEWLVCKFFLPKTDIVRKEASTVGTTSIYVRCIIPGNSALSYYQLLVWNNDDVTNPALPSPSDFGWKWEEEVLDPSDDKIITRTECDSPSC
jgi:hypothetical protein